MPYPSFNLSNVSNVHRCGRNSDIFCKKSGMISTGQNPPDTIIVGKMTKLDSPLAALLVFEYATMTNDTPTATKENSHKTITTCQNGIPKSILKINDKVHSIIRTCMPIIMILTTRLEAMYFRAVIGVESNRKYVRFSFSSKIISERLHAENIMTSSKNPTDAIAISPPLVSSLITFTEKLFS